MKNFLFIFAFLIVFFISDRILNKIKPSVYKFSEFWGGKQNLITNVFLKRIYMEINIK